MNEYIQSLGEGEEIKDVARLRALRDALTKDTSFDGINFKMPSLTSSNFNVNNVRLSQRGSLILTQ